MTNGTIAMSRFENLTRSCTRALLPLLALSATAIADESSLSPIRNWEAYALIDKHFQALDCESIGEFPPEEIDDHFGQVWLPVTAGQTQTLPPNLFQRIHHQVPDDTAAKLFADADRNSDGVVSIEESRDQFVRLIEQLDLNEDRWLTREELDQSEPGKSMALNVGRVTSTD